MVLSHPRNIDLTEFGIEIPVAPDRTEQVLSALRRDARLGPNESTWHIGPDGSTITREDLLRVHDPAYVARGYGPDVDALMFEVFELVNEDGSYHRYDPSKARRPLSALFSDWLEWIAGSYQCTREALDRGFCYFLGGGTHHAHASFGHGFCVFNDIVVAARRLQAEGRVSSVWVIDVDAHKGDGTAALTADDDSITSLSVHMADSWPLDLPRYDAAGALNPWFIPSTIDVPVARGEDRSYLPRLARALEELARRPLPDLAIVVDGSDPYEHDGLPSTSALRLTLAELLERDSMIRGFLLERDIPQAWLMAGGYGERAWEPFATFLNAVLQRSL